MDTNKVGPDAAMRRRIRQANPPRLRQSVFLPRCRVMCRFALLAAVVASVVPGCVRTAKVQVNNRLPVRLLVKRVTVPHAAYRTDMVLGWAEPNAVTTLPGSIGLASATYRLRAFAPDGRLVAEFNATQDELEKHLRGNIWAIEIRKPSQPAGKPKHTIK